MLTFREVSAIVLPKRHRPLRALVAILLAARAAPAQEVPRHPGDVAAAEQVEVLTLDVLAVDKRDRPVFGLTAADFEVRIAGKLQTLEFFEAPAPGTARDSREGRPDSEERLPGKSTPFTPAGATVRHVLFYVDLAQLPHRSVLDLSTAIRAALEHRAAGRYGFATHLGAVSARVWDSDSADAIRQEAEALSQDVLDQRPIVSASARGPGAPDSRESAPSGYEERQATEKFLMDDYVAAACAGMSMRNETQAISRYLLSEYRRVVDSVRQLRETCERFATLEGPRHMIVLSEGYERVPGYNFLLRLQSRVRDECHPSSAVPSPAAPPGMPGSDRAVSAGAFGVPMSPLVESDELARWIAASGITVHYVVPGSLGREMPSAEDHGAGMGRVRGEEMRNLQDAPLRLVDATGGLSRLSVNDLGPVLETFLEAASGTYRLGVRLAGVDTKKTYGVKVSVKRSGVTALARSAFRPAVRNAQALVAVATGARRASLAATVDERRAGATRLAKKPLPLTLEWKGRSSLVSKDPEKPFWKLEVKVPHEALSFKPEDDALLASVQIVVEAASLDGPLEDSISDDWFLTYTGPEYQEVRDTPAVRTVTLQLPPGRWELKVSVHDALADSWGSGALRVEAR